MEIRQLQTFVLAAATCNFTQTAKSQGITQAAVSQQVAALEKELNVSLFERQGKSVSPTAAGRELYEHARKILELIEQATVALGGVTDATCGTLKIAASTVPSEWLLPELLVEFRQQFPEVRESIRVSDSVEAIAAVQAGEVELGLVGEPPQVPGLIAKPIATDELALFIGTVTDSLPAAIGIKQLCRLPLIIREAGSASRHCVEQALAKAGLSLANLNVVMEANSNSAIRAAVEHGLAAAFMSIRSNEHAVEDKRLRLVKIDRIRPVRNLYLITDSARIPSRVARAFLEFIDQQANLAAKL